MVSVVVLALLMAASMVSFAWVKHLCITCVCGKDAAGSLWWLSLIWQLWLYPNLDDENGISCSGDGTFGCSRNVGILRACLTLLAMLRANMFFYTKDTMQE
eukprot:2143933-Ditylum_brightwellii.AAC.1